MVVNKQIKETLQEISDRHIEYLNTPDKDRKYLRRILRVYKLRLTEDEQVYVLKLILDSLHYKNIITDPENIIQLHNIRLRTITYVFLLTVLFMVIGAVLFKVNDSLNKTIEATFNALRILFN